MKRRAFVCGSVVTLVAPMPCAGQRDGRVWRLGWLSPARFTSGKSELDILREGLRELGYFEGRSIAIEEQWADGDRARLPQLARTLGELPVNLICTAGTPATLAAKQATESIPIVFGEAAFPERTGLVSSLARPGGNVTGATFLASVYGQRLALLREVIPRLSRVALLYNDNNPAGVLAMKETEQWAKSLRVTVEPFDVQSGSSLATALVAMSRHRPDALMTTTDPVFLLHRKAILEFAARHRLAAIHGYRAYVAEGGLMFYGHRTNEIWRHAATYVDRILKGAKAGELPVEQSAQFDLVINLKTAEALSLTIPLSVLLRADQVIE